MGRKRDILTEFQAYYAGLSDDAKDIVRRVVLTAPVAVKTTRRSPAKRGLPDDDKQPDDSTPPKTRAASS